MTQIKKGDRVEYVGHYDPWFGKQGMVIEAKSGELICVLMDGIHDVNDGRKSLSFEASTLRVIKDHRDAGAAAHIERELALARQIEETEERIAVRHASFDATVYSLFSEASDLLLRKHQMYSAKNISQSPGGPLNGLRVRIWDKVARINNIVEKDLQGSEQFESLEDSFIDLLNYSAIAVMVLRGDWPDE